MGWEPSIQLNNRIRLHQIGLQSYRRPIQKSSYLSDFSRQLKRDFFGHMYYHTT